MNTELLKRAVDLTKEIGHCFIATADETGRPHIAAAGKLSCPDMDHVEITEWFCPTTVANVEKNSFAAIIAWDSVDDVGYQLAGKVQRVADVAVLDGYAPEYDIEPLPQVQRQLTVEIERVTDFKLGPHSDMELHESGSEKKNENF